MIETLADVEAGATPGSVLASARDSRAVADAAEARLLVAAATWADLHPPESVGLEATFTTPGSDHEVQIAGHGCPLVAEFSIAELAAALGMSTTAGKRLVGHALELRHRLPRLWARVQAGDLPTWRARRVAEATIHADLDQDAARFVDQMVTPFAHRTSTAGVDRLVDEALTRTHGPVPVEDPEDPQPPAPDPRHVTIHDQDLAYAGTVRVEAELDLADALDLDHAVRLRAQTLKALGSEEALDARRATALGDLTRRQLSLDLTAQTTTDGTTTAQTPDPERQATARELVLHVHLSATVVGDTGDTGDTSGSTEVRLDRLATLEDRQRQVLLDHVQAWCADSHTRITVRPVLDLAAHLTHRGYHPAEALREQVILRDRTCRFPWCTRPARGCQLDHITPYDHVDPDTGGPTETSNLAALCTFHHRLKTHGGWTYVMPEPGITLWHSPLGRTYLHDHTGTHDLTDDPPPRP